jgi:hypothetical protein
LPYRTDDAVQVPQWRGRPAARVFIGGRSASDTVEVRGV